MGAKEGEDNLSPESVGLNPKASSGAELGPTAGLPRRLSKMRIPSAPRVLTVTDAQGNVSPVTGQTFFPARLDEAGRARTGDSHGPASLKSLTRDPWEAISSKIKTHDIRSLVEGPQKVSVLVVALYMHKTPVDDQSPSTFSFSNASVQENPFAPVERMQSRDGSRPPRERRYSTGLLRQVLGSPSKQGDTEYPKGGNESPASPGSSPSLASEKVQQRPDTWLPFIFPYSPVRTVAFGLDLSDGSFDFNAAAAYILDQIRELSGYKTDLPGHTPNFSGYDSIVFISHGYGSVVIPKMLGCDADAIQTSPLKEFRSALASSTAAIVCFANPVMRSRQPRIRTMTSEMLGISRESEVFNVVLPKHKELSMFATENDIFLLDINQLPLSRPRSRHVQFWDGPVDETDLRTITMFPSTDNQDFKYLCKALRKALRTHQILTAASTGEKGVIDALVADGHGFKVTNFDEQNALHLAVLRRDLPMVRTLFRCRHAKHLVDQRDANGDTPLHVVLKIEATGHDDRIRPIVEALLEYGASPTIHNNARQTPIRLARLNKRGSVIIGMLQTPPQARDPLRQLMTKGKPRDDDGVEACKRAKLVVTEIYQAQAKKIIPSHSTRQSVYDLIYSQGAIQESFKAAGGGGEKTPVVCRWYHIPANNMAWVNDLFIKFRIATWPWPTRFREGKYPHGRCMGPQFKELRDIDDEESGKSRRITAIMIPYIGYEDFKTQTKYTELINNTMARKRLDEAPESVLGCGENESDQSSPDDEVDPTLHNHKATRNPQPDSSEATVSDQVDPLIRAYLNYRHYGNHLPLHPRRTLDQSYYYMLDNTSYRDQTQVVSRWNHIPYSRSKRDRKRELAKSNHNILMVDQLWLWVIHPPEDQDMQPKTVVSCFPSPAGPLADQVTRDSLRESILSDDQRHPIHSTEGLACEILRKCICSAFSSNHDVPSLQFLEFFETAIGSAEEKSSFLFRRFRQDVAKLYSLHEKHRDYSMTRALYLKQLLDIRDESLLLEDVKDILDELKIIDRVHAEQKVVIDKAKGILGSGENPDGAYGRLCQTHYEIVQKFGLMEENAKCVEIALTHLLDLKQRQANLWEARSSRERAEETANQGNTLLVFTIVTIIFLPLSFMTSFFAIPVAQFPRDLKTGEVHWPLSYLCGLLFGISIALIIPLLLLAFNISLLKVPWNIFRHIWLRDLAMRLINPLRRVPSFRPEGHKIEKKLLEDWIQYSYERKLKPHIYDEMRLRVDLKWDKPRGDISGSGLRHAGSLQDSEEEGRMPLLMDGGIFEGDESGDEGAGWLGYESDVDGVARGG